MADVILFQPRTGAWQQNNVEKTLIPLGLLSISSYLVTSFDVKIIDARLDPDWKEALQQEIAKKPICFATTCFTGAPIQDAITASTFVRSLAPELPIIWGGVHPSIFPDQTISEPYVDYIVRGEGEITFFELIKMLAKEGSEPAESSIKAIRGLTYTKDGVPQHTSPRPFCDVNELPPVPYQIIDGMPYYDVAILETSRGCPYSCNYCYNNTIENNFWRPIKPEKVIEKILHLKQSRNISYIHIIDNIFSLDLKRVKEIAKLMIAEHINIPWGCPGFRIEDVLRMDHETMQLLKKSGITYITYGVESGSQRILDFINKNLSVSDVVMANRKMKAYDITNHYNFMCGFPGETISDLKQTVSLMHRLVTENPHSHISFLSRFIPYPQTKLFSYCKEKYGFQEPTTLEEWSTYDNLKWFPWVGKRRHALLEKITLATFGLTKTNIMRSNLGIFAGPYVSLSRWRLKHFNFEMPFELLMKKNIIPQNLY